AAVGGLVNPGILAKPGAQQVGYGFPEGFHIAEVEFCRAGDGSRGPGLAAVRGSSVGPFRAADPNDFFTDHTKAAKVRIRMDGLLLPLGVSEGMAETEKHRGEVEKFHGGFPIKHEM